MPETPPSTPAPESMEPKEKAKEDSPDSQSAKKEKVKGKYEDAKVFGTKIEATEAQKKEKVALAEAILGGYMERVGRLESTGAIDYQIENCRFLANFAVGQHRCRAPCYKFGRLVIPRVFSLGRAGLNR